MRHVSGSWAIAVVATCWIGILACFYLMAREVLEDVTMVFFN